MFDWVLNTPLILDSAFLFNKTLRESLEEWLHLMLVKKLDFFPVIHVMTNFLHEFYVRMLKKNEASVYKI